MKIVKGFYTIHVLICTLPKLKNIVYYQLLFNFDKRKTNRIKCDL